MANLTSCGYFWVQFFRVLIFTMQSEATIDYWLIHIGVQFFRVLIFTMQSKATIDYRLIHIWLQGHKEHPIGLGYQCYEFLQEPWLFGNLHGLSKEIIEHLIPIVVAWNELKKALQLHATIIACMATKMVNEWGKLNGTPNSLIE